MALVMTFFFAVLFATLRLVVFRLVVFLRLVAIMIVFKNVIDD